jgi:hypothetical protein
MRYLKSKIQAKGLWHGPSGKSALCSMCKALGSTPSTAKKKRKKGKAKEKT